MDTFKFITLEQIRIEYLIVRLIDIEQVRCNHTTDNYLKLYL